MTPAPRLLRYPVLQTAFVVADLDEGLEHWITVMGAGPFVVMRNFVGTDLTYRGEPSTTSVDYAFGQCGDVQVQLIAHPGAGD